MDAKALLDSQEAELAKVQREADDSRRAFDVKIAVASAKVTAMRQMWEAVRGEGVSLASVAPPTLPTFWPRKGGGRQPGAITKQWRTVLERLYGRGRMPYSVIHDTYVKVTGSEITASGVRDRVREMVRMGHMSGDAQAGFEVTASAALRFELSKNIEPLGSNEIEPLNGDPASGSIGEGYQPSLHPNPA